MAEYDLTRTIIPYLDRHLVFPLLTHLHESGLFTPEHVAAAQYELAKGTNMVDYIVSLYEQLNPDSEVPQGVKLLKLFTLIYPFLRRRTFRICCQERKGSGDKRATSARGPSGLGCDRESRRCPGSAPGQKPKSDLSQG
jgi:hypothetical protein